MDQPKIERLLRLMQMLSGPTYYTLEDMAQTLGMSERTVYRYIDTFRSAGYSVDRVHGNVFRMATMKRPYPDLSKIVYFSEEEAYIVNRIIDSLDNTNALKQGLHRKLAAIYDSTSIADYVDKRTNAANIQALSDAARAKVMAVLKNYESSHSGDIRDRRVEPFAFTTNYLDVWCFDPEDGLNKRFKIARIDSVEVLDEPWASEALHNSTQIDAFRMSGPGHYHVRLRLSLRAKNLLVEEYPLAEKDLAKSGGAYIFDAEVCALEGVGRFVSGLAADIEILEGDELRDYIRRYAAEHLVNI
ncbi:MAG: WYL domain-containing protein [Bacteroidales bacterium]|nr:WYL domain-containing protein [Bacteroidales bacterium]